MAAVAKREANFRIQIGAAAALIIFCLIERPSFIWCALFLGFSVLVLALELINSAVEAILDKLHPGEDAEVGFAKDAMAGAVLVASLGAFFTFIFFLGSKL